MMKRLALMIAGVAAIAATVAAGDIANFVDEGFSQDGAYYAFAQYGVADATLLPWAEVFVVDVAKNNFVPGGRPRYKGHAPITAGQDGRAALHTLLAAHPSLASQYGLSFQAPQARSIPLYVSQEDATDTDNQTITFHDYDANTAYTARITQVTYGEGITLRSSFFITITRQVESGKLTTFQAGTPTLRRPLVLSYTIRQVLTRSDHHALVFVVEKAVLPSAGGAPDIRYMVETLAF
jgi:predicted secreted protein